MPIMSDLVSELELHLIAKLLNEDRSNAREVIKFNKKKIPLKNLINFFRTHNISLKDQAYIIFQQKYSYTPFASLSKEELNHLAIAFFLVHQEKMEDFAPITRMLNFYFNNKIELTKELQHKINSNLIYTSSIKNPYEWTLEELVNIDKLNMDTTIDFEM